MTSCQCRLTAGATAPAGPVHTQRRPQHIISLPLNRNLSNRRLGISLRSSRHSKSFFAAADGSSDVWRRSDGGNESDKAGPCPCSFGDHVVENVGRRKKTVANRKVEVAIAAAATVVLGVGNRVLYKLALVPLKHYPFFLAQLAIFGPMIGSSAVYGGLN